MFDRESDSAAIQVHLFCDKNFSALQILLTDEFKKDHARIIESVPFETLQEIGPTGCSILDDIDFKTQRKIWDAIAKELDNLEQFNPDLAQNVRLTILSRQGGGVNGKPSIFREALFEGAKGVVELFL